jgi:hypothetical protein
MIISPQKHEGTKVHEGFYFLVGNRGVTLNSYSYGDSGRSKALYPKPGLGTFCCGINQTGRIAPALTALITRERCAT